MSEQDYDKEQLRILRNAFKAFDHDEKGYIEHSDVSTILEILGQKLDDKATKALIKEVDKGTTGKLDFGQFCKLAARFVEVEEDANALASELREAFRIYDKEGKGYLTVATLRSILHELDDKISNQDLDSIIEEIDADGSGTVDFDEFMQVMTGNNIYDFTINRRYLFEPPTVSFPCKHPSHHRLRLHRRIEWHFDRLLDHLWRPIVVHTSCRKHLSPPSPPLPLPRPIPALKAANTVSTSASNSASASASASASVSVRAPSNASVSISTKVQTQTSPSNRSVSKVSNAINTTTSSSSSSGAVLSGKSNANCGSCCYRTIFRPRFPRWVPILTLYHEIVHNPFRRRGRYMIAHY